MASQSVFLGWIARNASSISGKMEWTCYEPKAFEETDIEIKISHCGICGNDLSHLRSGWKPADYPIVAGHEIIGHVVRVGNAVQDHKIGDRVGIGAPCESCLGPDCTTGSNGQEQHCPDGFVTTYDARFADGSRAYGGFGKSWRGPGSFAFRIPDNIPSAMAAPLLCAGVTVYSPLVSNGAGPGQRVGVVGLGGLGHFAVLFAKALKCDRLVAISRSPTKRADALQMGADEYIATSDEPDWSVKHASSLDLIISTMSGTGFSLDRYLSLLDVNGTMILVGAPDDPIPSFNAFSLLRNNRKVGGSLIGSRKQMREMLELASRADLQAWVQTRPMAEANQAIVDMGNGKAKYRYVLVN